MSIARLDAVAPDIAELLRSAPKRNCLAAAVAAARLALGAAGVREPMVDEMLKALDGGAAVELLIPELKQLVEHYDQTYFQWDAKGDEDAALTWFSQARALSALVFAAEADPFEACYESQAATDVPRVRAVIQQAIEGKSAV